MFSDDVSRAVLFSAPDGILVVNSHGRIVLANSQTEELLGYGPGGLLNQQVQDVLPELYEDEKSGQFASSDFLPRLSRGRVGLELRALRKDGTEVLLEVSLCTVDINEGPLVCCILRKMHETRQSKHDLGETEERFRLLVENSNDILTVRNADGKVRYTSPSIHRVLGYKQEEMIGATGFELIHPEDRSTVENALNEFWKSPGARDSIQYRARHANGSWVFLEVVAYNLLEHPDIRGVVINGRDISERKGAQAERESLSDEVQETAAIGNALAGILAICAFCKKIKNEAGIWEQIEVYFRDRTALDFSHGMCPECANRWYPEYPLK